MSKIEARVLNEAQLRSMALPGGHEAWALQFEYVRWRRSRGLEPAAERLNRWHLAMEEIGQKRSPGR
jgi:hypothetical protein